MLEYTKTSSEEAARLLALYEPLTESVRRLIDATLRTEVGEDDVASAKAHIDAAVAKLRSQQIDGTPGISVMPDGDAVPWGNVAMGPRNPVAPPLRFRREEGGLTVAELELGAAYEGAPGHLHGGYAALVLDHAFGHAAAHGSADSVAATGTFTLRYERPTRLGRLRAEARIERVDGRKRYLVGELSDDEGVTVRAEAVMVALRRES